MTSTENNSGWRAILTHGLVYRVVQFVFSEKRSKQLILDEFVSPSGGNCVVLDMGCGPGNLFNFLPESVEYTGFDVSQDYIDLASAKYRQKSNARFLCGAAESFLDSDLIENESVDVVVIHGVLHHVTDEIASEMFELAQKKLKVGGRMVVLEPVWFEGQSPLRRWVMKRDRGNNIKTDTAWKQLFFKLSQGWATTSTKIEQNLIQFYDLIVLTLIKSEK